MIKLTSEKSLSLDFVPLQVCIWVDPLDGTAEFTEGNITTIILYCSLSVFNEAVNIVGYAQLVC